MKVYAIHYCKTSQIPFGLGNQNATTLTELWPSQQLTKFGKTSASSAGGPRFNLRATSEQKHIKMVPITPFQCIQHLNGGTGYHQKWGVNSDYISCKTLLHNQSWMK